MKPFIKNLFFLPALITSLGLMPTGRVTAQTFTTLHTFSATSVGANANNDGALSEAGLILSGNVLYGTAHYGGANGSGTVFAVNTYGTGFTNLYSFTATGLGSRSNSDGASPQAGLILSGNVLYGTAYYGGSGGSGTVFAINTDGTGFTNLYSFTATGFGSGINSDGANPQAGLILSGNTLYGTTLHGGANGSGAVFAVNTDGTGFTNLYSFSFIAPFYHTNSDGANPQAGLILSGNTLYGTTLYGGSGGSGVVFAINTNGTGFTNLYSFTATGSGNHNNSDGANPQAGLILSGNTLYGTAYYGSTNGNGTVFALNTDGTGFTNLYSFSITGLFDQTYSDGANPQAGLILSGNVLYGTTRYGGSGGSGTVFAVNTDGTGFANLYSFSAISLGVFNNSGGANPQAGLILSGNTLYGTAYYGGSSGNGTVFSLSLPVSAPQLTIIPFGANVILTWPTNATGFTLQSTTNFFSLAVWKTNLPSPVVVNGQNSVTNPISGTQQFYRLQHP